MAIESSIGLITCPVLLMAVAGTLSTVIASPQQHEAIVDSAEVTFNERDMKRLRRHTPVPAPPPSPTNHVADDPDAAHFGQFLFFETRFASDDDVSCATCHDPGQGFADGLTRRWVTIRHTQSLWNVVYNRWVFWDGRADSLWSQALKSIESPVEYNGSRLQAARVLHDDPELRRAYETIFGQMPDLSDERRFPPAGKPVPEDKADPQHAAWSSMTVQDQKSVNRIFANIGKAIEAYQRRLISDRSLFDVFVEGLETGDEEKQEALSQSAKRGLKLFISTGNCRSCHVGYNFTDGEFHNIGVPPLREGEAEDVGRYLGAQKVLVDPFNALGEYSDQRTGEPADKLKYMVNTPEAWAQFKTPTLRNVAKSPPYMHQGQVKTLRGVLRFYSTLDGAVQAGHHQESILRPLNLTEAEIDDLIAFLESLTDEEIDPSLKRPPDSPLPQGQP